MRDGMVRDGVRDGARCQLVMMVGERHRDLALAFRPCAQAVDYRPSHGSHPPEGPLPFPAPPNRSTYPPFPPPHTHLVGLVAKEVDLIELGQELQAVGLVPALGEKEAGGGRERGRGSTRSDWLASGRERAGGSFVQSGEEGCPSCGSGRAATS